MPQRVSAISSIGVLKDGPKSLFFGLRCSKQTIPARIMNKSLHRGLGDLCGPKKTPTAILARGLPSAVCNPLALEMKFHRRAQQSTKIEVAAFLECESCSLMAGS